MAVLIDRDDKNVTANVILIVIGITAIIIVLVLLWYYVISPRLNGSNGDDNVPVCIEPPSIPSGLTANISGNAVSLTWTSTSNTDSYNVHVSPTPNFQINDAERTISVSTPTASVINLLPQTYYFKISSQNTCGSSNVSSEISATIIEWPGKMKICKDDNPNLCLLIPDAVSNDIRVSFACPNNSCDINYVNNENLSLFPGGNFCVQDEPALGTPVEDVITSQLCTTNANQKWDIDLSNGIISNSSGFCIGANNISESSAFNTDCSLLVPNDPKYKWSVEAIN